MLLSILALVALLSQQSAESLQPEVATLRAGLGSCSAEFTVKDAEGQPVYAATIHVRVRYGVMGIKRADLEVGTNIDGAARIEGLPDKARLLVYDVRKADLKGGAEQDVASACHAKRDVSLR